MATQIDQAYIKLDLDTSLFDKKFKSIKAQIEKLRLINIDIKSNIEKQGSSAGSLAQGAVAGAVAGGVAGGVFGNKNNIVSTIQIKEPIKDTKSLKEEWKKLIQEIKVFGSEISKIPSKIKDINKGVKSIIDSIGKKIGLSTRIGALGNIDTSEIFENMPDEFGKYVQAALNLRNAIANIRELKVNFEYLFPNFVEQIKKLKDKISVELSVIYNDFKDIGKGIIKIFSSMGSSVKSIFKQTFTGFDTGGIVDRLIVPINKFVSKTHSIIKGIGGPIIDTFKNIFKSLVKISVPVGKLIGKTLYLGVKTGILALRKLKMVVSSIGKKIGKSFVSGFKFALSGLRKIISSAIRGLRNIIIAGVGGAFAGIVMRIKDLQAIGNLEASFATTGKTIKRTAEQAKALVKELDRTTDFEFPDLAQGAANLATFTNIAGDMYDKTLKMAVDLSAAFGQDLKSSVIQLGKALNDPIKGVTALSRVGVSFTKEQIAEIKRLVEEENNVVKAQQMIIDLMGSQGIAGQAKAMASPLTQIKKGFQDWLKTLGQVMERALRLNTWIGKVRDRIDEARQKLLEWTKTPAFKKVTAEAIYFAETFIAGIILIVKNLGAVWNGLKEMGSALRKMLKPLGILINAFQEGFNAKLDPESVEDYYKAIAKASKRYHDNLKAPIEEGDIKLPDVKAPFVPTDEYDDLADSAEDAKKEVEKLNASVNVGQGAGSIWSNAVAASAKAIEKEINKFKEVEEQVNEKKEIKVAVQKEVEKLDKEPVEIPVKFKLVENMESLGQSLADALVAPFEKINDIKDSIIIGFKEALSNITVDMTSDTNMSGMIVGAIKEQTNILHKDLTKINSSIEGIAPVI